MRKIDQKIVEAVRNKRTIKLSKRDNVIYRPSENVTQVLLWNTTIAMFFWNSGLVEFDSRGWRTQTTRNRINALMYAFTEYVLFQKDHEWRVVWRDNGADEAFHDRMVASFRPEGY